ncbi:hypothetical protein [[Eubacterium] hominis]|uniref:hypothetical protein n=1 Tax=[Eubacterium] hominis TaxID=2764325 RepID=UPI003A4D23FC
MPLFAVLSLGATFILLLISVSMKLAGKLRLTLPFIYLLVAVVSTFFTRWTTEHEQLVLYGLYALIVLSILSWLKSLKDFISEKRYAKAVEDDVSWQIQQAKKRGIQLEDVYVDSQGTLRYNDTNEPII